MHFTVNGNFLQTTHEYRAPTDDSIRLALELREKLWTERLEQLPLQGNVIGDIVSLNSHCLHAV